MKNATATPLNQCPSWCSDHFTSDYAPLDDSMHRWEPALPDGCPGDMSITLGLLSGDLPELNWAIEESETHSQGARAFVAALIAAADKLDEINGLSA
jgi:hypothetical protein